MNCLRLLVYWLLIQFLFLKLVGTVKHPLLESIMSKYFIALLFGVWALVIFWLHASVSKDFEYYYAINPLWHYPYTALKILILFSFLWASLSSEALEKATVSIGSGKNFLKFVLAFIVFMGTQSLLWQVLLMVVATFKKFKKSYVFRKWTLFTTQYVAFVFGIGLAVWGFYEVDIFGLFLKDNGLFLKIVGSVASLMLLPLKDLAWNYLGLTSVAISEKFDLNDEVQIEWRDKEKACKGKIVSFTLHQTTLRSAQGVYINIPNDALKTAIVYTYEPGKKT